MRIEEMPWDSNFFEMRVGRCDFIDQYTIEEETLRNWDLIYFFVNPKERKSVAEFERLGIPLVDRKVVYYLKDPARVSHLADGVESYQSSEEDDLVVRIGLQSGAYSRFKLDARFPKEKFEAMYKVWVERSITREIAHEVFVYRGKANDINGVITLEVHDNKAGIGIFAVDVNSRGAGIGTKLLDAACNFAFRNHLGEIQVVTQKANLKACEFYEKSGFLQKSIVNIYHYWR